MNNSNIIQFPPLNAEQKPLSANNDVANQHLSKMQLLISNIENYGDLLLQPSLEQLKSTISDFQELLLPPKQ